MALVALACTLYCIPSKGLESLCSFCRSVDRKIHVLPLLCPYSSLQCKCLPPSHLLPELMEPGSALTFLCRASTSAPKRHGGMQGTWSQTPGRRCQRQQVSCRGVRPGSGHWLTCGHLLGIRLSTARHGCCVLLMVPLLHLAAMQRRCPLTDDGLVHSPTLKGHADQPCLKAQCLWLFVFLSGLRGQPCSVVLNSCVYCHVYCIGRIMGKGNYGHTCPAPGSEAWQWQRPAPPSPPTPTPTHVEGDASSGEEGERSRQHGMAAKGGLYVTCCGLGFTTILDQTGGGRHSVGLCTLLHVQVHVPGAGCIK